MTPDFLNLAGFQYDASGGYADMVGFRYGTSREFSMWGWMSQSKLALKQKPLLIMDVALYQQYGELNAEGLCAIVNGYKENCHKYGGMFSMLWHNNQLFGSRKSFFESVVGAITIN